MNYYEVLGIRKTATPNEIKSAYKKLVKKYHPDIYPGDKSYAELKIKEINSAYEVLSNPTLKQEYDDTLIPTTTYSYTPPKYSETYSSKYSYDNYKKKYNTTSYRSSKDYSTYNYNTYDTQSRYTDYHRSKTPNSNYTNTSNDFTDNLVKGFDNMRQEEKILTIFFVIVLYFIFVIINIFQLSTLFDNTNKDNTSIHNYTHQNKVNQYYDKSNNSIYNQNSTKSDNFDINDYFTDDQLRSVYEEEYKDILTFSEFKELITEAYKKHYY